MNVEGKDFIIGRNPVIEALAGGREIEKIMIAKGAEGSIKKIAGMAKDKGIPIHYSEKRALDSVSEGANHQGVIAFVSAHTYCEVDDILRLAEDRKEDPFVLILDGIEDPHNLGAIIRTAEAAGVHGVIIPKRRAVGITPAVTRASAGASQHMLCAKVSNIAQTIDNLKKQGLWIGACDMGGSEFYTVDLKRRIGLVIGGEGSGIGKLVREKCDFICSIPMKGKINSLNASNAAAILLYEVRKQRDGK